MVVLLHVSIALVSIVQTTFLLFSPSKRKLQTTYILFFATLISGTYLLITMPTHMVQTCVEGLVYMGFVVGGVVVAKVRMAKALERPQS